MHRLLLNWRQQRYSLPNVAQFECFEQYCGKNVNSVVFGHSYGSLFSLCNFAFKFDADALVEFCLLFANDSWLRIVPTLLTGCFSFSDGIVFISTGSLFPNAIGFCKKKKKINFPMISNLFLIWRCNLCTICLRSQSSLFTYKRTLWKT